jgi:hypothetical protein
MPKNPQEFADLLGAKIVGEVPDVGGGPFGMARLAHLMHQRLTPGQGERLGRPTDATWSGRPKVPMSAATRRRLAEIAEQVSTPERRVSPMQVAAQLLEEAVNRVAASPAPPAESAPEVLADAGEAEGQSLPKNLLGGPGDGEAGRKKVKQRKTGRRRKSKS